MNVAILGDAVPGYPKHATLAPAIGHAAAACGVPAVTVAWLGSERLAREPRIADILREFDALVAAPQSAEYCQRLDGVLRGIRYARESGRPLLGTCGGYQLVALEFARNVLGMEAEHPAFGGHAEPHDHDLLRLAPCPVASDARFRLEGPRRVRLDAGSRTGTAYGDREVEERFACSYVLGDRARGLLAQGGLRTTAEGELGDAAALELDDHPFYVGVAFLPQWRSEPDAPHPLFAALLRAARRGAT